MAEDASGLVGAAAGIRRDLTWILATFVVRPGLQGRGIGRHLLPVVERVREGSHGDVDRCDSVDRRVRDAAQGVDHEIAPRGSTTR